MPEIAAGQQDATILAGNSHRSVRAVTIAAIQHAAAGLGALLQRVGIRRQLAQGVFVPHGHITGDVAAMSASGVPGVKARFSPRS